MCASLGEREIEQERACEVSNLQLALRSSSLVLLYFWMMNDWRIFKVAIYWLPWDGTGFAICCPLNQIKSQWISSAALLSCSLRLHKLPVLLTIQTEIMDHVPLISLYSASLLWIFPVSLSGKLIFLSRSFDHFSWGSSHIHCWSPCLLWWRDEVQQITICCVFVLFIYLFFNKKLQKA